MIKRENVSMKRKRIECNNHGLQFKYHCEHPTCKSPYLCGEGDCIDDHFHDDGKLVMTKFDSKLWESKFQQVENVLNSQTLKVKEESLTKLVDFFRETLQKIQQDMSKFQEVKSKICENEEDNVTPQYFENINGFLSMGCKLERRIDALRAKIIDEDVAGQGAINNAEHIQINESHNNITERESETSRPIKNKQEIEKNVNNHVNEEEKQFVGQAEEDDQVLKLPPKKHVQYYENRHLATLLSKYVNKFEWASFEVIFSSQSPLTTCERFHEKLRDRRNLLFLFIGDQEIIGSFYSEPYPSISDKYRKDPNSFIFISDENLAEKFAVFAADSQSEYHMIISEKLLICHGNTPNNGDGLRTFQRTLESLSYFLPSISFKNLNTSREVNYNGVLRIKEFYVLQQLKE